MGSSSVPRRQTPKQNRHYRFLALPKAEVPELRIDVHLLVRLVTRHGSQGPNRCRYSPGVMKAFTISASKGDEAQAYEWFLKAQKRTNPERVELFQKAYEASGWQGVRQKHFELNRANDQLPSANYGWHHSQFRYNSTAIQC